MILLMLSLAILSGGLGLALEGNLSNSSISYHDRMYIRGKDQLKAIEAVLNLDPRFPDCDAFLTYVLKNPHMMYQANGVILSYVDTITLPGGQTRHRFQSTEKISSVEFPKPVKVRARADGSIELQLQGILE